jgi:hypothetical protein
VSHATASPTAVTVEEISTEQGLALLEQHAQERFGLSWPDFHEAYMAGKFQGTPDARQAEELAFLAPLAG